MLLVLAPIYLTPLIAIIVIGALGVPADLFALLDKVLLSLFLLFLSCNALSAFLAYLHLCRLAALPPTPTLDNLILWLLELLRQSKHS